MSPARALAVAAALLSVAVVPILVPWGCSRPDGAADAAVAEGADRGARVGQVPPDPRFHDLGGKPFRLSDLRGKVALVTVWATWCTPCVHELPMLQDLHEELGPKGLEVVAVSVDTSGAPTVMAFAKELGLGYTVAYDPEQRSIDAFEVRALPTTLVLGRDGRVAERVAGLRTWNDPRHRARLAKLLAESGPSPDAEAVVSTARAPG